VGDFILSRLHSILLIQDEMGAIYDLAATWHGSRSQSARLLIIQPRIDWKLNSDNWKLNSDKRYLVSVFVGFR
jgi:hypothetical protein